MRNRADEIIYLMRTHPGYGYRAMSGELLTGFIRYEWSTNRWAMMVDEQDHILGWVSWYTFNDNSLQQIKENGLPGCVYKKIQLSDGPNLYLANVFVREEADRNVFRKLWRMAMNANQDALTCSAFLWNRKKPLWRWKSFKLPGRLNHGRR